MAKQTICYRSDAGNDFPSEHEALKDDLRFYIFNVIKNEATAKQLAEAMTADLMPLYDYACLPVGMVDAEIINPGIAALVARLKDTLPASAAPDHVAWDGKRFVGALSGHDKGDNFFNRWYTSRTLFPVYAPGGVGRSALAEVE